MNVAAGRLGLPGTLGPGQPDFGIDPGDPLEIDVPSGRGGYTSFRLNSGNSIRYDVFSPDGRPVVARIYDKNGILTLRARDRVRRA